jgi:hypothetical protein
MNRKPPSAKVDARNSETSVPSSFQYPVEKHRGASLSQRSQHASAAHCGPHRSDLHLLGRWSGATLAGDFALPPRSGRL